MRLLTVDASVFVSAARRSEKGHAKSVTFLRWVRENRPRLFLPTLVLVEVAAALRRTGSDPELAYRYALSIGALPRVILISLDEAVARQAASHAAAHALRGADAVYLATATHYRAALVTLDHEQLKRGAAICPTFTPGDFLERGAGTP